MANTSGVEAQRARAVNLRAYLAARYGLRTRADAEAAARGAGCATPRAAGLVTLATGHGKQGYPEFQYTGDSIRPGWAALIQPLRDAGWTDEDIALWLAAPTGWLNNERPADLLDTTPKLFRTR